MRTKPLGCVRAYVIAIALMNSNGAAAAAQERSRSGQPEAGSASTSATTTPREQPRLVRIPDPLARRATVSALNTAVALFEDAGCRKILTDFADRDGRPLADRLTSFGVDFDQYVSMLVFYDGTRSRSCDKGVMAFTTPGSRVVYVCVDQLKQVQLDLPDYVVAALIHEILHTLGLGENPPSSSEITKRVLGRCFQRKQSGNTATRGCTKRAKLNDVRPKEQSAVARDESVFSETLAASRYRSAIDRIGRTASSARRA